MAKQTGFFYRKGRGWYVTKLDKQVPLKGPDGKHLKDPKTPKTTLREAAARVATEYVNGVKTEVDLMTVADLCGEYLDHCLSNSSKNTFKIRVTALFDLCTGLPIGFRDRILKGEAIPQVELKKARLHEGYGKMLAKDVLPLHIHRWVNGHAGWVKSKRTWYNAVRRMFNFGVELGVLTKNPIRGIKVPEDNVRNTYITPEVEAAMYAHSRIDMREFLKVAIRTGARYGIELLPLTAAHVEVHDAGLMITYQPNESKTRKLRQIIISSGIDPASDECIAIIKRRMGEFPKGPIFRNGQKKPWTIENIRANFDRLKSRLHRNGIETDENFCLYSTRHTYAKRTLQGFWTGKAQTLESLSRLMGNTLEICYKHYAKWQHPTHNHLWGAS